MSTNVTLAVGVFAALSTLRKTKEEISIGDLVKSSRCSSPEDACQWAISPFWINHHQGVVVNLLGAFKQPRTGGGVLNYLVQYACGVLKIMANPDREKVVEVSTLDGQTLNCVAHYFDGGMSLSKSDGGKTLSMVQNKPILLFKEELEGPGLAVMELLGLNAVIDPAALEELQDGKLEWKAYSQAHREPASQEGVFVATRQAQQEARKAAQSNPPPEKKKWKDPDEMVPSVTDLEPA